MTDEKKNDDKKVELKRSDATELHRKEQEKAQDAHEKDVHQNVKAQEQTRKQADKKDEQPGDNESGTFSVDSRDPEMYAIADDARQDADNANRARHLNRDHHEFGYNVGREADGTNEFSTADEIGGEDAERQDYVAKHDTGAQSPPDHTVNKDGEFVGQGRMDRSKDGRNKVYADEVGYKRGDAPKRSKEDEEARQEAKRHLDLDRDIDNLPQNKGHMAAPEVTHYPISDAQSEENYRFIRSQKAPPFALDAAYVKEPPYPRDPTHKAELDAKHEKVRRSTNEPDPMNVPTPGAQRRQGSAHDDVDEARHPLRRRDESKNGGGEA